MAPRRRPVTVEERALANLLAERVVAHDDVWVVQNRDGGFRAVRRPLGVSDLVAHLRGIRSVHSYATAPEGSGGRPFESCLWGAFDIDAHSGAREQRRAASHAARALVTAAVEIVGEGPVVAEVTGGAGLHVWVLLAQRAPAPSVARLMDAIRRRADVSDADVRGVGIERYPKQEALLGRLGSSLRLPLGVHPRTGHRSRLIDLGSGETLAAGEALGGDGSRTLTAGRLADVLRRCAPAAASPAGPVSARAASFGAAAGEPVCPHAWATYRWLVERMGLAGRSERPPPGGAHRHSVRCVFPERHVHADRSGSGSAYLIMRGDRQLYGCAVCMERAVDTLGLIRLALPDLTFTEVREIASRIDPGRCPAPSRTADR